jgi:uncharacterized RDD family membrane protein YckC
VSGVSPIPREARPYQGRRAGLVSRFVACCVDTAVVGGVLVGGYLAVNGVRFLARPRGFELGETSAVPVGLAFLGVLVVYLTGAWATTGRTYGNRLLGLRVLDRHGHHLRPHVALVRAVLYAVFPLGLFWCAVDRSHRSVPDLLLGTVVSYDWLPRSATA